MHIRTKEFDMKKYTFTIHDVIKGTACIYDTLFCLACGKSSVLIFLPDLRDAKCTKCGKWQLLVEKST